MPPRAQQMLQMRPQDDLYLRTSTSRRQRTGWTKATIAQSTLDSPASITDGCLVARAILPSITTPIGPRAQTYLPKQATRCNTWCNTR
eukprot:2782622-Pyramimonas_sp.AAC.1